MDVETVLIRNLDMFAMNIWQNYGKCIKASDVREYVVALSLALRAECRTFETFNVVENVFLRYVGPIKMEKDIIDYNDNLKFNLAVYIDSKKYAFCLPFDLVLSDKEAKRLVLEDRHYLTLPTTA